MLRLVALAVFASCAMGSHPSALEAAPCVRLAATERAGAVAVTATASEAASSVNLSALQLSYSLLFLDTPAAGDAPRALSPGAAGPEPPAMLLNASLDPSTWNGNFSVADLALPDGSLLMLRVAPVGPSAGCSAVEHGVVMGFARIAAASAVPPFFVFSNRTAALDTDEQTPTLVVFAPSESEAPAFYSNVRVRRAGSDRKNPSAAGITGKSKDWPKHKMALAFPNSSRLVWRNASSPRAGFASRHLELRSMYAESGPTAYMREALALRLFQAAGVPCADSRYVRVFLNGTFRGLYLLTERIDEDWLSARGFGNGSILLSTLHYKYSNLRSADPGLDCPQAAPDSDYAGKGRGRGVDCPVVYKPVYPKTSSSDLARYDAQINAFTTSLYAVTTRAEQHGSNDSFVQGFWSLRTDESEILLEMALQTLILNVDRCTKNHFLLFRPDGRLLVIPTDLEDAFATDDRAGIRDCAANGNPCQPFCYLSCDAYNSIWFCDRQHPQDPQLDKSTYNHLVDAVLYTPMTKARYFDVLRAVYARYSVSGWLDAQVKDIASLIGPDARADVLLWNTTRGGFDDSVNRLLTQISVRRSSLAAQLKALNDTTPAEAAAPAPALRPRVATL